jgi:DNA primase
VTAAAKKKDERPAKVVDQAQAEAMMSLFSRQLLTNGGTIKYIESRGLGRDMAEAGEIGYCPPYAANVFPLLKGRIVVPIRDVHSDIVAFAGRIYEPSRDMTERAIREAFHDKPADAQRYIDKWNRGKWINETFPKRMHLYGLHYAKPFLRDSGYVNIVEGYLDALVLQAYGMENTAAVCGTALTEWHCALLSRYCQHVVLMLDGDEAGEKAAEAAVPKIVDAGLTPHCVILPPGRDPDEIVLKFGTKKIRRAVDGMVASGEPQLTINF